MFQFLRNLGSNPEQDEVDEESKIDKPEEKAEARNDALGMSNGSIPDSNVTASSWTAASPPRFGRLNYHGSWCARYRSVDSYLEVDLGSLHEIKAVATQGNPERNFDYVKSYKLQHSIDGKSWMFQLQDRKEIIDGNTDHFNVKLVELQQCFKARFIRFWPQDWYFWPCMRVEMYGEAVSEDDVKTAAALTEASQGHPTECDYTVTTYTGNKWGAGTDANVLITIYGKNGDTGERKLDNDGNNFENACVDAFPVKSPHLGKIKKIRIGHDNTGFGAAWYLDKVTVSDPVDGKLYEFPAYRWFPDETDGSLFCDIAAPGAAEEEEEEDKPAEYSYTVTTYTGNKWGAGTDANVLITIFGADADTGERKLDNTGNMFENSSIDAFAVKTPYLGPMKKIRIGHDNTGLGAAWYLDKVTVNDPKADKLYEFPCDRWFPDETDGSLFCEISVPEPVIPVKPEPEPEKEPEPEPELEPAKEAEPEPAAEPDETVPTVEIIEQECTPEIDVIKGPDVNSNVTITTDQDPEGTSTTTEVRETSEDGGTIITTTTTTMKTVVIGGDDLTEEEMAAGSEYIVNVHTGDKFGAGTDANVVITLIGETGELGEMKIDNEGNTFESGSVDTFNLWSSVHLGELQKIRIGHDNSGAGPAWYLDKVTVEDTKEAKSYEFPCARWFPDDDDGLFVRDIENPDRKKEPEGQGTPEGTTTTTHISETTIRTTKVLKTVVIGGGDLTEEELAAGSEYIVNVHTGDKFGTGTDANVVITLIGENGELGEMKIDNEGNTFESGSVDKFNLWSNRHLGELQKIRIGHDNSGAGPAWFLDKVTVEDKKEEKVYEFPCARWFPDDDDGLFVREIENPDRKKEPEPTEIVVKLDIKRTEPETPEDTPVKVEEVIEVKSVPEPDEPFPEFELKTVKTIKILRPAGTTEAEDGTEYVLCTHTGDKWGAGTDANVLVTLFGENGSSGEFKLDNEENNFESGGIDTFKLTSHTHLGELQKIRLGHDNSGLGPAWYVDKITVEDTKTDKLYEFPCNCWFPDENDGSLSCEIELPKPKGDVVVEPEKHKEPEEEKVVEIIEMESAPEPQPLPVWEPEPEPPKPDLTTTVTTTRTVRIIKSDDPQGSDYTVSTFTGDKWGAGTDANVLIVLFGENGDSGEVQLDNSGNNFENEQKDTFEIGCEPHLGDLQKIRIGHDNTGMGPAWYVDKVTVLDNKTGKLYEFPCNRWFPDEDDGSLSAEIELPKPKGQEVTVVLPTIIPVEPEKDKEPKVKETVEVVELKSEPEPEPAIRTVTTTRTVKIIRQGGLIGEPEGGCEYIVSTYTGDKFGAGTDANVIVSLFGEGGETGEFTLDNKGDNFESGKKDTFKLGSDAHLGDLNKIRIGHDNTGMGPAWYLDKVTVLDTKTGKLYEFPCNRWFPDENDGSLSCDIELPKPKDGEVVIVTGRPEPEPDVIETSFKSETEVTRVVKKQTMVTRTITVTGPSGEPETTEVIAEPKKRTSSSSSISSSDSEIQEFAETPRITTTSQKTAVTTVVKTTTTGPGGIQIVEEHTVPMRHERPPIARPESLDINDARKEEFPKPKTRPYSELILPPSQRTHKTEAFEIPLKGNVGVWVPHPESCVSSDMMGDTEFERLLSLEREDPDLWTRVKKNRDAEVWKRNGEVYTPIHKAYLTLDGVPYNEAKDLIGNWNTRPKWDKTFGVVHVLDDAEHFKVLYMCINTPPLFRKRDIVLATKEKDDKTEDDAPYHIVAWRSTKHPCVADPEKSPKKPCLLRVEAQTSGMIIRPIDDGNHSSKVTVITQLPGSSHKQINHTYLAGNPLKWQQQLKKYYAEEHKPSAQQIELEKERRHREEEHKKQERKDSKKKKKEEKEREKKEKEEREKKEEEEEKRKEDAEGEGKQDGETKDEEKIEVAETITVETKPEVEMAIDIENLEDADKKENAEEVAKREANEKAEKEKKDKDEKEEKARKLKEEKDRKKEEEKERSRKKKEEAEQAKKEKKEKKLKEKQEKEDKKKAEKEREEKEKREKEEKEKETEEDENKKIEEAEKEIKAEEPATVET